MNVDQYLKKFARKNSNRPTKELDKLQDYLDRTGVRYERIDEEPTTVHSIDRHQIIVYSKDGFRIWDAICHYGSYGAEKGLLEIYGVIVPGDDVEGWLTADDVIKRWEAWLDGKNE